jgi:cell division protein FtsL
MKRNTGLLAALLFLSCPIQAGVYKHVDEHGKVTYSNVPSNNAKKIDLPPLVVVPSIDSGDVEERIAKRRETMKLDEQREQIQSKITEEEKRLSELKSEYKDGNPDRLGSERNYQRYLNRVERIREEIDAREKNLNGLKKELQELSGSSK